MKDDNNLADPRIGKLTREDAKRLKDFAISIGLLDCMPYWMRKEIEEKTAEEPPNRERA